MGLTTCQTNLSHLADSLGVHVRTAPTPAGLWAVYDHRHELITMRPGLGSNQYISTLAHELGHAHYGHIGHSAKAERQADRWAAKKLLTFQALSEAADLTLDTTAVAAELGVLPWVVKTFIGTLDIHQTQILLEKVRGHHA